MPKERFSIKTFNGAAPATGDAESPIRFENARVDVANNVAVPENVDLNYDSGSGVRLMEKTMYVDGVERTLSIERDGAVEISDVDDPLGYIRNGDVPSIEVIGRHAVISGSGSTKFVRVGYPQSDLIYPPDSVRNVFENDIIKSRYIDFSDIISASYVKKDYVLMLYRGARYLVMAVYNVGTDDFDYYYTADLADSEIVAMAVDYAVDDTAVSPPPSSYEATVNYVYYAYYSENSLKIRALDLASCFPSGSFDDTIFENSSTVPITDGIAVIDETYVPSGCTLNSMAVTDAYCFLAFNEEILDELPRIGHGDNCMNISVDNDLLFSFNKLIVSDGSVPIVVKVDGVVPLYRSKLPFMPYKRAGITSELTYRATVNDYYEWSSWAEHGSPIISVEHNSDKLVFIPNEWADFTKYSYQAFFSDLVETALSLYSDGNDAVTYVDAAIDGWITFPGACGMCGALDYIEAIGCINTIDYANNVVGYAVRYKEMWIPKCLDYGSGGTATGQSYINAAANAGEYIADYGHNATRYLKLSFVGADTFNLEGSHGYEATFLMQPETWGVARRNIDDSFHIAKAGSDPKVAFFCWNGVEPDIDFEFIKDVIPTYSLTESETVTKYFDDGISSIGRDSEMHQRFALLPNIVMREIAAYGSGGLPASSGDTIKNIIAMSSQSPTLIWPEDDLSNLDIGYSISNVEAISPVEGGAIHAFTPTFANMITILDREVASIDTSAIIDNEELAPDYDTLIGSDDWSVELGMPILSCVANTEGSDSFDENTYRRYKIAFIYDGTSVSPLSDQYTDAGDADKHDVDIVVTVDTERLFAISKRITAICIYCANLDKQHGSEADLYRLVREVPLTYDNFTVNNDGDYETPTMVDTGVRYASFNANSGYSETMRNVSVDRECQCICNSYLFAGNIRFPYDEDVTINTDNLVVRSLPFQMSIFNYTEDFCVLPFTPIALVPFNSRVYALGSERYAIINSDSLAIEHISNSCGISDKDHAVTTDYGIFVYYNHNLYHVNNAEVKSIGDVVRENNSGTYAMSLADFNEEVFVGYVQSRNAVVILGCREETDSQDSIVMMFAYGIATGKWASYEISEASTDYPISLYDKDDSAVFTMYTSDGIRSEYQAFKLFAGAEKREMLLEWIMDCGDPDQDKFIYSVDTYNGRTPTNADVLVGGAPLQADTDAYNTLAPLNTFTLRVSDDTALSEIRLLMRRMVVHNE